MWVVKCAKIRRTLLGILAIALASLMVACGGLSTGRSVVPTVSSVPPASQDDIAANWVKFFDGTQPVADKIGLLENGQQYASQLQALATSPIGKTMSATMSSVTITSPTTADVKYSVLVNGKTALADQLGKAVLQDGVWKVGVESFQALLNLEQGSTTPSS